MLYHKQRTMAPLQLHQLRSMLDCAIDDCVGLGVEVFGEKLGEKRRGDWSKFGRLCISDIP
jgi:hypothetical protein